MGASETELERSSWGAQVGLESDRGLEAEQSCMLFATE